MQCSRKWMSWFTARWDWVNSWGSRGRFLVLSFQNFFLLPQRQWHSASTATPLKGLVRCVLLRTLKLTSPCLKQIFITREIDKAIPKGHTINSLCLVLTISVTAVRRQCHVTKSFHSGFKLHLHYDLPPCWKFQRKEVPFLAIQQEEWLEALFSLCCDSRKGPFLTEIGRNKRTSFSSGGEPFLPEEGTEEQFPALPAGSPALSQPHTVSLGISKAFFRGID